MAYTMHGHTSDILEANSKRSTREKRIRKQSKIMLKKLNGLAFFL